VKKVNLILICLLLIIFLPGCKNDNPSNPLFGKWIDTLDYNKCIQFIDNSKVLINGSDFNYEMNSDSIYFQIHINSNHEYSDFIYMPCPNSAHKIRIDYSLQNMEIENMNTICFLRGDTGITAYSKKIHPNKFIGEWITTDLSDTLYFKTNDLMERPEFYYNSRYKYSYTCDSLTVQYAGPNKIYVRPATFKYNFSGDTLIINLYKDYYWNIQKGLKKFLKSE
jgi:hypothetical protein